MCCFVILLLSNEMQMSVRRFSAIPHLRAFEGIQFFPPPAKERGRTKRLESEPTVIERKKLELVSCLILSYCLSSCLLAIHFQIVVLLFLLILVEVYVKKFPVVKTCLR